MGIKIFKSFNYKLIFSLVLFVSLVIGVTLVFFTKDNTVYTDGTEEEIVTETEDPAVGGGSVSLDPPKLNFYYDTYPIEPNLPSSFYEFIESGTDADGDGFGDNSYYRVNADNNYHQWTEDELNKIKSSPYNGRLRIHDTYNDGTKGSKQWPVTHTFENLFDWDSGYGNAITELYIGSNITHIGEKFAYSGSLTATTSSATRSLGLEKVYLGKSVLEVGASAFYRCCNIKTLNIPENVVNITDTSFDDLRGLEILYYDAVSCEYSTSDSPFSNLGYSYKDSGGCRLVIGDKVKKIPGYLFGEKSTQTSYISGELIIPDSVETIGFSAFGACKLITKIVIGRNVDSIASYAFHFCYNVSKIEYNAIDCESLGENKFQFCLLGSDVSDGCEVVIGDSVTSVPDFLFYNDTDGTINHVLNITKLTIGKNVSSIGKDAFQYLVNLEEIIYNAKSCNDPSSSNYAFYKAGISASSLISLTIGEEVKRIPAYLFGYTSASNSPEIGALTFLGNQCEEIGKYAFYYSEDLTDVNLPDSVEIIKERAFYNCTGITNLTIGRAMTTIEKYALSKCGGLQLMTVRAENLTTIGDSAFDGIGKTTSDDDFTVVFTDEVVSIPDSMFEGESDTDYYGIKSITIGRNVTTIGDKAFAYLRELEEVYYNATNSLINSSSTVDWHGPFINTGSTSSPIAVTIASNVQKVPSRLFTSQISYITSVVFEEGSQCLSIGNAAFLTAKITKIELPDTLEIIGNDAFGKCENLNSINIPDSVKTIGSNAFDGCGNGVIIGEGVETIGDQAFRYVGGTIKFNAINCRPSKSTNCYPFDAFKGNTLIIGKKVQRIATRMFACNYAVSDLRVVEFEEGSVCSFIGKNVFYGCGYLEDIDIGQVKFNGIESNWYFSSSESEFGTKIEDNLQNAYTAAKCLTSTYTNYFWHRVTEVSPTSLYSSDSGCYTLKADAYNWNHNNINIGNNIFIVFDKCNDVEVDNFIEIITNDLGVKTINIESSLRGRADFRKKNNIDVE